MPDGIDCTLGGKDYRIVPQGIGRIKRKLGKLLGLQEGTVALDGEIDGELYDVLKTFIPDIAPLHTLLGYGSEDEYKAGGDPEGGIAEVTLPQLLDAIETIYRVNGADRLVRLGKGLGLDGELIRGIVNKEVASWALDRSPSLPAPSGGSDFENSTTSEPISPGTSEPPSPSPDSSTSSSPATPVAA